MSNTSLLRVSALSVCADFLFSLSYSLYICFFRWLHLIVVCHHQARFANLVCSRADSFHGKVKKKKKKV